LLQSKLNIAIQDFHLPLTNYKYVTHPAVEEMASNHQQSSAVTLKEAEGKISLVSTFSVGICDDQEMPEAPADRVFKGDCLFMKLLSPLPFELFDGLRLPNHDARRILSKYFSKRNNMTTDS
jgi:hypothetical protein